MERKLVSENLYGGSSIFDKKKNPFELEKVFCNNSENCPLFKAHKCIRAERLNSYKCKYCEVETKRGPSSRSSHYFDLKHEYQEDVKNITNCILYIPKFFPIGDEYFLNLRWRDIRYNEETKSIKNEDTSMFSGWSLYKDGAKKFFSKELITTEFLKSLIEADKVGHQFLDGWSDITNKYIKDDVEPLKLDIKRFCPDLAKALGIKEINYVGRKALLTTLKPPFNFKRYKDDNRIFRYNEDGTITAAENISKVVDSWLVGTSGNCVGTVIEEQTKITFKPNPKLAIIVEDNNWVLPDTEFVNN